MDLIQFGGKYQRAEVVALLESELYNHRIPEQDGDSCNCQCCRQTLTQLDNKTHKGGDNRFQVRIQRNVLCKFRREKIPLPDM